MDKPLLSICIPTYNRADIVYECVNSCLEINCEWIEVVVTDNCSNDGTGDLLANINDRRFRYIRNEKQLGYTNLAQAIKNGRGKYSLLLSDEDDLYNVDWELLQKKLSNENLAGLIYVKYYDQNCSILNNELRHRLDKSSAETIMWALSCRFCGGIIYNTEIVHSIWNNIDKDSVVWTTYYPQTILALYCVVKGDCDETDYLSVRRSHRDGTGTDNLEFKRGGTDKEPYWSYKSREWQNKDFLRIICNLDLEKNTRFRVMYNIRLISIDEIYNYYYMIHNELQVSKNSEFKKFYYVIERDIKKSVYEWIIVFLRNNQTLRKTMQALLKRNEKIPIMMKYDFVKRKILTTINYICSIAKDRTKRKVKKVLSHESNK